MERTSICICDASALKFWRSLEPSSAVLDARKRKESSARRRAPGRKPDAERIDAFLESNPSLASEPLDLLVSSAEARLRAKGLRCHVCSAALPRASFVKIDEGVWVVSPEFCFARLAFDLPPFRTAQIGLELCGRYRLPLDAAHGFSPCEPLATRASLSAFVDRFEGGRGVGQARTALRYVQDGSESPRETVLALLFDQPLRSGGCGLPLAHMNHAIPVPRHIWRAVGKRTLRCDLLWPEAKLAVEYDSDLYHTGADRIAADATRRTALAEMGFEVVTVANRHLRNAAEFQIIARHLGNRLGKRFRPGPSWLSKHIELREQLLHPF